MPQVFGPRTNVWSQVSLVAALLLLPVLLLVLWLRLSAGQTGTPVTQPVPFSHQVHVGLGLDCRYCHTSVETSSSAGMPSTQTCMTCHSQILADDPLLEPVRTSFTTGTPIGWVRVHSLPDFVYFDHSIHLAKGIACETCHGRVDQMAVVSRQAPLTMAWCVSCHLEPERHVRPRELVFKMGYKVPDDQLTVGRQLMIKYHIRSQTDCIACHR
jgi:Cytochrome c7 and related cytochrome c